MNALSKLSADHGVHQHRRHDIQYSFVDNRNGTFSPVAIILDSDGIPYPVTLSTDVHFQQPLEAVERALVEAMMAVNERIRRSFGVPPYS